MGRLQYDVCTVFLTILDHWNLSANSSDQKRSNHTGSCYISLHTQHHSERATNEHYILGTETVATPLWAKCESKAHTPKSEKLESFGTPKNSERNCRSQISSHLSVLSVIGKVLKCRCLKWPWMSHLDTCSPSCGQKKGQESNWQFDSRPLKVENRPVSDVRSRSATWRWKALFEGYNFGSDLVRSEVGARSYVCPKSRDSNLGQFRDSTLGVPGKRAFRMPLLWANAENTIGSMVVASPESGSWCVLWVWVSPWLVPTPNACRMTSNQLVLVLNAGSWPNSLISS
jgi:hypothetical protein